MLVAVEPEEEVAATPVSQLKRFMVPGLIAAGVLVGIGVGALIAGGGSNSQPESAANAPASTTAPASASQPTETARANPSATPAASETQTGAERATPAVAPPPPAPVAQVYIKLLPGDQVAMNGNPQALVPSPNGFAMLQLPPGDYRFSISNNGQTRDQSITVDREGVWLLNPQS
jgi:hypothetical protein